MQAIFAEACRLADKLRAGLRSQGHKLFLPEEGPILNFVPPKRSDLDPLIEKLGHHKVSCAKRGPGLRFALHAFNTDGEVAKVLELTN
jgi:hypothetical protein